MSRVESAPDAIIEAPDFNPALTLNSGQVFHWTEIDGWWEGLIADRFVPCANATQVLSFEVMSPHPT